MNISLDKQRILKEAQQIAKEFSFWMVSGNIAHLYGHVYESSEKKYELEIKFDENFPQKAPELIYGKDITELIGDIELNGFINWTPESLVVDIIHELKTKIQETLQVQEAILEESSDTIKMDDKPDEAFETEEYITPDLDAYPPDFQYDKFITPQDSHEVFFYNEETSPPPSEKTNTFPKEDTNNIVSEPIQETFIEEDKQLSILVNTELGLIQQEYAYDQVSQNPAEINVYITITLAKTFIIQVDFTPFHFPSSTSSVFVASSNSPKIFSSLSVKTKG